MTIDRAEGFEMGRVVSRTFGVLMRNAGVFLPLAAVLTVPVILVTFYFTRSVTSSQAAFISQGVQGRQGAAAAFLSQTLTETLVSYLVIVIFTYVLQAALVQGTIADLNGERPSLGNCLGAGFKSFGPLMALAVLSYLGMVIGFILLVVPGIILALMWSVVVPVFLVENAGVFASFGRSRALTEGARWKIFWLVLLYTVIAFLIQLVVIFLAGVVPSSHSIAAPMSTGYLVGSWIVRIPLTALLAVGIASIYYELRLVKEGVGPQQLAAAFD